MKQVWALAWAIVLLSITGCEARSTASALVVASGGAAVEPLDEVEIIDDLDDLAGTWGGTKGATGVVRVSEDGTWIFALDQYNLNGGVRGAAKVRFEGAQLLISESVWPYENRGFCEDVGVYRVERLADGSLKFTAIRDECERRIHNLQGDSQYGISVEWKPLLPVLGEAA